MQERIRGEKTRRFRSLFFLRPPPRNLPLSFSFLSLSPSPPPLSRRFWPSVLALFFVVYIVTFPLSCKITPRIRSVFSWCMPGGDGRGKAVLKIEASKGGGGVGGEGSEEKNRRKK